MAANPLLAEALTDLCRMVEADLTLACEFARAVIEVAELVDATADPAASDRVAHLADRARRLLTLRQDTVSHDVQH